MRRHTRVLAGCLLAMAGAARKRRRPPPRPDRGYVEAFAESAFGNVTSQSFGAEVGFTVRPNLQVFGSFGQVRDAPTPELGAAAQTVAGALAQVQSGAVTFR